jgi:hypothetical protein
MPHSTFPFLVGWTDLLSLKGLFAVTYRIAVNNHEPPNSATSRL